MKKEVKRARGGKCMIKTHTMRNLIVGFSGFSEASEEHIGVLVDEETKCEDDYTNDQANGGERRG